MNFIGDFFALGLVTILCLFFFDGKHSLNRTSWYFVAALLLTALNAITDIASVQLLSVPGTSLALHMAVNSLYFVINLLTTTSIALYLFTRILEHSHDKHCMKNAVIGLMICLAVYLICVVANFWTGWMFYFDPAGEYCRGPLNGFGYFMTMFQMGLVVVCYLRNRKNASRSLRRALTQTFPVIVMTIMIQRLYPEIMLNSFIMSMVELVLFLSFQGQRQGVHALTRLNDRHRFFENIDARLKSHELFQVFIINIKNFGVINQKYGHMQGDEVLYHFAFALEKLIRGSEAFHMNGTVFALIMPYANQHSAEEHTRALMEFMESGIEYGNERFMLNYVLVEHISGREDDDTEAFYEKLEYASAKAYSQKDRYIRYTPELGAEMVRSRYMIERLQTIDREHGFEVWYQPIFCQQKQQFCSMEALVRMVEPDGSVVSSGEFIPLAEQTGMLMPVTWFVVEEVCRLLAEHPELDGRSVTINMPMVQMLEPGFAQRLNSLVDRYGIAHERIGLEITERAIMGDLERAKLLMWQLCDDGYRFYLDDFGEGFSNFNCLMQLPFHVIKLDAALISRDLLRRYQDCWSLTQTLTNFLHNIGLKVIAEGVETAEDAQKLWEQGVDRIQGYAFARPMDEAKLLEFYSDK